MAVKMLENYERGQMKKILFIQNQADQYWVSFCTWLYEKNKDYSIQTLFLKSIEERQSLGLDTFPKYSYCEWRKNKKSNFRDSFKFIKKFIQSKETKIVICSSYNRFIHWVILFLCALYRVPFVLHGDSNFYAEVKKNIFKIFLKKIYLFPFMKCANAFWTMGTMNKLYWLSYGAKPQQLFESGFCPVDTDLFLARKEKTDIAAKRKELGIASDSKIILYVGRFVDVKNVPLLIDSFEEVSQQLSCSLILLGKGPKEELLRNIIVKKKLKNVIFAGAVKNTELPLWYQLADVYVQPSFFEPAGIVIHEALLSGLPVIASDACGYSYDILIPHWNGFVFKSNHLKELTAYLNSILENDTLRKQMADRSSQIASVWNYQRNKKGLDQIFQSFYSC